MPEDIHRIAQEAAETEVRRARKVEDEQRAKIRNQEDCQRDYIYDEGRIQRLRDVEGQAGSDIWQGYDQDIADDETDNEEDDV